jgi:hypothetical protein
MHSKAIRWPSERFQYIGVDPPASTGFDLESAIVGELENAAKPFESDPYGCHTSLLQEKRKMRYVFYNWHLFMSRNNAHHLFMYYDEQEPVQSYSSVRIVLS